MKWRTFFVFLTGFWLHEVMGHVWMTVDEVLPFTSKLLGLTITYELNAFLIAINSLLLIIFAYFAFSHDWSRRITAGPEFESRRRV